MENFMQDFLQYALYAKLIIVGIYIIHTLRGPTIWDRMMGLNLIATKTIMIFIVFSSLEGITFLLDLAIMFALFGFLGTVFLCLFLAKHKLGRVRSTAKSTSVKEGSDA
ncbi:MAG: monovalent cation/H+ antiporter complex subunit F [Defluviitaleaceae bacterium]|nr:monovalent cation/H+ antiporter complex subunit F [Defluviitaleaceae bacterium]